MASQLHPCRNMFANTRNHTIKQKHLTAVKLALEAGTDCGDLILSERHGCGFGQQPQQVELGKGQHARLITIGPSHTVCHS